MQIRGRSKFGRFMAKESEYFEALPYIVSCLEQPLSLSPSGSLTHSLTYIQHLPFSQSFQSWSIHPKKVDSASAMSFNFLKDISTRPNVVAMGEMGTKFTFHVPCLTTAPPFNT